jgi:hypothetical protein
LRDASSRKIPSVAEKWVGVDLVFGTSLNLPRDLLGDFERNPELFQPASSFLTVMGLAFGGRGSQFEQRALRAPAKIQASL